MLASVALSVTAAVTPSRVSAEGTLTPVKLADLQMTNQTTGWAATGHWILRTTDGGHLWTKSLHVPGPAGVNVAPVLTAFGGSDSWVAQEGSREGGIWVWATSNGGMSWRRSPQIKLPSVMRGGMVHSLQFLDSNRGWMMVTGSAAAGSIGHELLQTTDGGLHWRRIEFNDIARRSPHSISACDFVANVTFAQTRRGRVNGWATGLCGGAWWLHTIYRSYDGGHRWFVRHLPVRPIGSGHLGSSLPPQFETYPPTFIGSVGILPVSISPPARFVLYRTTDAGNRWIEGPSTPTAHTSPGLAYQPVVTALNPQRVWVLTQGRLLRTADGGRHWTLANMHPGLGLDPVIQFVNPSDGFAISSQPRPFMRVTADGGRHWHNVSTVVN